MVTAAVPKPRVFISSTIRDLRDVRSALRYWIEAAGYDVQLSEYNDFDRRPEDNVFQSCFNNIATTDYYILLVGSDRGSWYNEAAQMTVTRQEFRVACETAQMRPLSIFVFVREEVDTALKQWNVDGRPSSPSPFIKDPEFTAAFLQETREAGGPENQLPRWTYRFGDFRDIVDGLRVPLQLDADIEQRLLKDNLIGQLLHNLSLLCTRTRDGNIFPNHWWTERERSEITIPDKDATGALRLSSKQAGRLGLITLAYPGQRLRQTAVEEALRRGLFLSFDIQTTTMAASEAHQALQELHDDMESLLAQGQSDFQRQVNDEFMLLARNANSGSFPNGTQVDAMKLASLLALHDKIVNVFSATAQFIKWLLGAVASPTIDRAPQSPIEGMSEAIEAEKVTTEQLRWALANDVYPFGSHFTAATRKLASKAEEHYAQELRKVIPEDMMDEGRIRELIRDSLDKLVVEPGPKT